MFHQEKAMPSFVLEDAPFTIHVVGDRTKKLYPGEFRVVRFLTHRQMLNRDRLIREFLGGTNPEISAERARATALADCAVSITKAPTFWTEAGNGLDLVDENVLLEVWRGVQKIQADASGETEMTAEEKDALKKDAKKASESLEE
jgi:hypothetical protein